MANFNIALIKGDGVGPEVMDEGIKVLGKISGKFNHKFILREVFAGGNAIDKFGEALPDETLTVCKNSDAALLGAVGGPKWDTLPGGERPERALLGLREGLGLFSNLRPALMHKALSSACPLKPEISGDSLDIMIVRELTGGIYFGEKGINENGANGIEAYDVEKYSEKEIRRIAKHAFTIARKRDKKVCSVDKANVLESSRLWRKIVCEVAEEFSDVELTHMYVDNAAMQLVKNPKQFDVIVTSNIFGDILSDEASMITGSIGMLPSASLGDTSFGMYEPIHGSAPDIAGKNIANPIATILSIAMMLRHSFNLEDEAVCIENAVTKVLDEGFRTADIMSDGFNLIGTSEMGEKIVSNI